MFPVISAGKIIYKRANSRLHFLRQLKKAAVSCKTC